MFRFVRSQSGSMLLVIICLFVLIGALVIAGASIIGPQVKRGKINDTKTTLNSAVDSIVSWSVANGRIPKNDTEIQAILPNPDDSWGKPLIYLYDANLADSAIGGYGGLCGRTTTATSYNGQYIAFVVLSGGDDSTIESTPNPSPNLSLALGALTLQSSDIYRLVTLDELQSRAGCSSRTKGRLRIVNNEIPNGCSGKYKVTLYADGGVSPGYSWLLVSATPSPPTWTPAPQSQNGAFAVFSSSTTPLGASNKITFQLADGQATVQRTYNLKTTACGGCTGYRVFSNTGIQNDFMLGLCRGNLNSGSEVTNGTPELIAGGTITRFDKAGNCKPSTLNEQVSYAQAVSADVNGNCQVNYGPGGVVTDR